MKTKALMAWLVLGSLACSDEQLAPLSPGCDDAMDDEECVARLLSLMTLEEKVAQMHGVGLAPIDGLFHTPDNERLAVPGFRMVDGPRGVRAGEATAFPVGMARGATWDEELETQIGEAMGAEVAAKGGNVLLAPTINLLRHPAWGRAQETYGEDTYHIGRMGVAFIGGVQRHVIASAKHFALNSIEDTRFDVNVTVDERSLREVYLPHFRRAVQAGVGSVMSAYNQVNGAYCAENEHLLRDILKGEWGFAGFVESDWVFGTHDTVASARAGLDVEMPAPVIYGPDLVAAVGRGEVSMHDIDDAVGRILRTKRAFRIDRPPAFGQEVVQSEEHLALARQAAEESMVLLKNDGALPLASPGSIAVVGTLASRPNLGDSGSSDVHPSYVVTPLAGIEARFVGTTITHVDSDNPTSEQLSSVVAADAAIVVVGLTADDEGENLPGSGGDRERLSLSGEHIALVSAVAAASKVTIVIVEGGSAVTMEEWIHEADAVLMAWYPGMLGGDAVAAIVAGDVNPSGKLPISIPTGADQLVPFADDALEASYGLYPGYRHLDREGLQPRFEFGFGLSYTTFGYVDLTVDASTMASDGHVTVNVDLTNEGSRAGAEIVQLYVGRSASRVERPERELKGFARVWLEPGQTRALSIDLPVSELAYFDVDDGSFAVEPGEYLVQVGRSSRDLPLSAVLTVP